MYNIYYLILTVFYNLKNINIFLFLINKKIIKITDDVMSNYI
jgi:hypothetical protein